MNLVRHGNSMPSKSRYCRATALLNSRAALTVIQPAELNGFKRRATAVFKSNQILEFNSARQ